MAKRNRELWCEDLAWASQAAEAEMGLKAAALERSSVSTGLPNTDLYGDRVIGWGNCLEGAVERHRRIQRVLAEISVEVRTVLAAHYRTSFPDGVADAFRLQGDITLAGACLLLCKPDKLGNVLNTCREHSKSPLKRLPANLKALRDRAEQAVRAAHRAYYDAAKTDAERQEAAA